ncbi:MAG: pyridoxine 5'-phosphate synthase [Fibrobacterota bacterium]
MPLLSVNIDHTATLRQVRLARYPDLREVVKEVEKAGAGGITAHLREDRRHIQDNDLFLIKDTARTRLNMEMAATDEMVAIALKVKPYMVTIVPEKRQELTTEGGLDVVAGLERIKRAAGELMNAGIQVSLFIDPSEEQVNETLKTGAAYIELHTGRYCGAPDDNEQEREFQILKNTTSYAAGKGLRINAGHGLDYENTLRIAELPEIEELNIGHSIIARAVICGIGSAVSQMLEITDIT